MPKSKRCIYEVLWINRIRQRSKKTDIDYGTKIRLIFIFLKEKITKNQTFLKHTFKAKSVKMPLWISSLKGFQKQIYAFSPKIVLCLNAHFVVKKQSSMLKMKRRPSISVKIMLEIPQSQGNMCLFQG